MAEGVCDAVTLPLHVFAETRVPGLSSGKPVSVAFTTDSQQVLGHRWYFLAQNRSGVWSEPLAILRNDGSGMATKAND